MSRQLDDIDNIENVFYLSIASGEYIVYHDPHVVLSLIDKASDVAYGWMGIGFTYEYGPNGYNSAHREWWTGSAAPPSEFVSLYGDALKPNYSERTFGICGQCDGPVLIDDYLCGKCRDG